MRLLHHHPAGTPDLHRHWRTLPGMRLATPTPAPGARPHACIRKTHISQPAVRLRITLLRDILPVECQHAYVRASGRRASLASFEYCHPRRQAWRAGVCELGGITSGRQNDDGSGSIGRGARAHGGNGHV